MNEYKTLVRLYDENSENKNTEPFFTYSRKMPVPSVGEFIFYKNRDYRVIGVRHLPVNKMVLVFVVLSESDENE